jgi:hypothetical protein
MDTPKVAVVARAQLKQFEFIFWLELEVELKFAPKIVLEFEILLWDTETLVL